MGGKHIHRRMAEAQAVDSPTAVVADEILGHSWGRIGDDLWRPGDGLVSRAFGAWVDQRLSEIDEQDAADGT